MMSFSSRLISLLFKDGSSDNARKTARVFESVCFEKEEEKSEENESVSEIDEGKHKKESIWKINA